MNSRFLSKSSEWRNLALVAGTVLSVTAAPAHAVPLLTLNGQQPIVIAHRGASGYLPEETLESYKLAVQLGANFIEPDLWVSKDGVLVARHDATLNATTNVAAYAQTHPDILALGTGNPANLQYAISNFTFAQIQDLTATRRNAAGYRKPNSYFDAFPAGHDFNVMSLEGVLDYLYELYVTTGKIIGIEPEAKATGYEQQVLDTLTLAKYNGLFDGHLNNVILQTFIQSSAEYWNSHTSIPVIWLRPCPTTQAEMDALANIVDGIGGAVLTRTTETTQPDAPPTANQLTVAASAAACVESAHNAGLLVQAYTFYDVGTDYGLYLSTGLDGIFSNFPDVAVAERNALFAVPEPGTTGLLAIALAGLAWVRGRRRVKQGATRGGSSTDN